MRTRPDYYGESFNSRVYVMKFFQDFANIPSHLESLGGGPAAIGLGCLRGRGVLGSSPSLWAGLGSSSSLSGSSLSADQSWVSSLLKSNGYSISFLRAVWTTLLLLPVGGVGPAFFLLPAAGDFPELLLGWLPCSGAESCEGPEGYEFLEVPDCWGPYFWAWG